MAAKKTTNTTSNASHTSGKVMTGVGIAALAAATAGMVFLYGTEAGKKKRKEVKSFGLRMKADVIDKMEKMKEWNEESYHEIIDSVAERYNKIKSIDPAEVGAIVSDLRSHWKTIKKQVETTNAPKKKPSARKSTPKKIAAPKPESENKE